MANINHLKTFLVDRRTKGSETSRYCASKISEGGFPGGRPLAWLKSPYLYTMMMGNLPP